MIGLERRRKLPHRPPVGAQFPAGKFAPSRFVDLDGLVLGGAPAGLDLVESPNVKPASLCEFQKGAGKPDRIHDNPSLDDLANLSTQQFPLTFLDKGSKNGRMSKKWLQRDFFRALVDAKVETGISKEMQAQEADVALSTFITHYSGDREPGKKTLHKFASYYQVELSALTDDPGSPVGRLNADDWANMTPAKRLILRSIAQKIAPDDVTDERATRVWKALDGLIEDGTIKPPKK